MLLTSFIVIHFAYLIGIISNHSIAYSFRIKVKMTVTLFIRYSVLKFVPCRSMMPINVQGTCEVQIQSTLTIHFTLVAFSYLFHYISESRIVYLCITDDVSN